MVRSSNDGSTGDIGDTIRACAFAWQSLDAAVATAREAGGVAITAIKLFNKGDRWLVIVSAEVEGECVVTFSDASSSMDLGKVVRGAIAAPDWKPDKFKRLDKKPA